MSYKDRTKIVDQKVQNGGNSRLKRSAGDLDGNFKLYRKLGTTIKQCHPTMELMNESLRGCTMNEQRWIMRFSDEEVPAKSCTSSLIPGEPAPRWDKAAHCPCRTQTRQERRKWVEREDALFKRTKNK